MAMSMWLWALRLAALLWLFLACQGVLRVREVVGWGWYGEDDPTSWVVLVLLPLALAWIVVVALSYGSDRLQRLAAALALGLAVGGIPLGALWLLQLLIVGPRAGDTPNAMAGFTLYSVAPLALALAASIRLRRALRPIASTSRWDLVLTASGTIGSFGLSPLAQPGRPCILGPTAVIEDLRTIVSGEAAYAASNDGAYAPLYCLARPTTCLAGYPAQAPFFLHPSMLEPVHKCYRFTFHPGPPAPPVTPQATKLGRDSVASYAVTAVPAGPWGKRPAFCMDASGVLVFSEDGRMHEPKLGRCPANLPYYELGLSTAAPHPSTTTVPPAP